MYYNFNDISIYYEKYGNGNKNILILPGWGDTRKTFMSMISYLKEYYTVYIVDYPGFGNSSFPKYDLTIYDYTNYIRKFIKDLNITNSIIIAHSFGGRIATLLTGYYKEDIEKLVFIDVAPIKHKKTIFKFIKEKTYKMLKKVKFILPKKYRNIYLNKLLNVFGSSDYKSLPCNMQKTFQNIVGEDLTMYLNNIKQETLIIWGELDKDTPLKDGIKINSLIKNSAIITLSKAGHFSYLDYPILTNRIIKEFLK
ncbi:MAG: alpha/beta hydrolase [Firmicutes bacterium]|nr:alpha/beta hydrolase [Bacillota bacterium]